MKARIVNLGLIREAELETTDLSIIMGLNNSGKSTAATVLYAAVKAGLVFKPGPRAFSMAPHRGPTLRALIRERVESLERASKAETNLTEKWLARYLDSFAKDAAIALLEDYAAQFIAALELSLGTTLPEMARRANGRRQPLKIQIENSADPWWRLEIRLRGKSSTLSIDIDADSLKRELEQSERGLPRFTTRIIRSFARESDIKGSMPYYLQDFSGELGVALFQDFPQGAHYLPAARAGLLQSHRLVAAAMLQANAMLGLRELSMPSLSGVVADFVSEILLRDPPPRRDRQALRLAKRLEDEVLRGRIEQARTVDGYPEIEFTDESGSYPIHRTSSMVSELAPIVLLLQRSIRRGELLIIEEPESHLHPSVQVALASILFEAANLGLTIFITSHSDFFVSQINNLLREAEIARQRRPSEHGRRQIGVSAYWCRRTVQGSHLEPLNIDPLDGIPENSFAEVAGDLYDKQVAQQLILGGSSDG